MSVGDIKGARRRFKQRQRKGEAPKKQGLSTTQLIERNRRIAANQAKTAKKG
jgi:hypothetical protein